MKRTGEMLKKAREQKGLSINEIALSLKISSKILKSIEDGDSSQLPAKTFLRGFVQSYANYLRLDVNDVLKTFQDEMGTTKPAPLIQMPEQDATLEAFEKKNQETAQPPRNNNGAPSQEKPFNSLAKNNNSKTVTFSVLGLVLVGLIVFTKKMIDKYQKEGTVSEVEVTTPLATATPEGASAEATPAAEAALGLSQTSPSPAATAMSTPIATPTPMASVTATPKATPTATPAPSPTATPTATPSPSPSASPSPSPSPANKQVEVIIEALDNVEVEYSTKDGKTEKITLNAEQVHTFKSKSGLKINVSNGGAVNVIVNGKDLGIPGNLGKPVKLNF